MQLKHTKLCMMPSFMAKLISIKTFEFCPVLTPWTYEIIPLLFVSCFGYIIFLSFSIFFLKIGVCSLLCIFYFLYLNYSTPTFLQIGTFQMKSIGKQFLFWEPCFTPLSRLKLSFLSGISVQQNYVHEVKDFGHVYIVVKYF